MDYEALLGLIDKLLPQLKSLCEWAAKEQEDVQESAKILHSRISEISESWSGSWLGHHATLYYEDFRKPPFQHRFDPGLGTLHGLSGNWYEVTLDAIKEAVEHDDVLGVDDLIALAAERVKRAVEFRDEVMIALGLLKNMSGFEAEAEILSEVESHKWGFSAQDFAKYQAPKSFMTRDARAIAEGVQVPPHVLYDCNVLSAQSKLNAVEEFCRQARRLLAQTKNKIELAAVTTPATSVPAHASGQGLILQICKGFHQAARQMRERHDGRPTLDVNDEYDVQDLIHAILRLHFEDVRAEEYTPSYAGGSSRMDFLLKPERVVLEVKKTRAGLTAKVLGEELIVDIARYRAHPDVGTLVCFVYDPDGRIANPRGIESDLNALSTDSLKVVVLIEPS